MVGQNIGEWRSGEVVGQNVGALEGRSSGGSKCKGSGWAMEWWVKM